MGEVREEGEMIVTPNFIGRVIGYGLKVFPCVENGKEPTVQWPEWATGDFPTIATYWGAHPRRNIAVACKHSGLVVLDLDTAKPNRHDPDWLVNLLPTAGDRNGATVLSNLAEAIAEPFPGTYTVMTPSGGWHLYFRAPVGVHIGNRPLLGLSGLIDVRAAGGRDGGYVVAEGSVIDGKPYHCIDERPIAPLPAWLQSLLTTPPVTKRESLPVAYKADHNGRFTQPVFDWSPLVTRYRETATPESSNRNNLLHWAAAQIAEDGGSVEQATDHLLGPAMDSGLSQREARKTIRSAVWLVKHKAGLE
jgi:hypothetical protein